MREVWVGWLSVRRKIPCFLQKETMRDLLLLLHFIGLIIGAGCGFSLLVIGILSPGFPADARPVVMRRLFALRYISYGGLALLLLSGMLLAGPYWGSLAAMPYFVIKLAAVAGLIALSVVGAVLMHRIKQTPDARYFRYLAQAGKSSMVLSMIAVTGAVYSFH